MAGAGRFGNLSNGKKELTDHFKKNFVLTQYL